jgi:hypothetical protein
MKGGRGEKGGRKMPNAKTTFKSAVFIAADGPQKVSTKI